MTAIATTFKETQLKQELLKALSDLGYESPTPIQSQCIPHLLEGKDLLGQARTGTGKTAAFALPALNMLDLNSQGIQTLVLTPTRELGIQVADSFLSYGKHFPGFRVAAIYGGQDIRVQLRQLKQNPQVVVATPGRLMDHMNRGSIRLDQLQTLILDEADEMLRMGFIDDVEYILEHTPPERQTVLFSATMPDSIMRVARKHLKNPVEVRIKNQNETPTTVDQFYRIVRPEDRTAALVRFLDGEDYDAAIVFVKTRVQTAAIAEFLNSRGHSTGALNGDLGQNERERIIKNLKNGKLDVVVATDVAARGLDVSRITHVFNYDPPSDVESYVHRVGRTGRAGRNGRAILLLSRRETRLVSFIEKAMGAPVKPIELPDHESITALRVRKFTSRVLETAGNANLDRFEEIIKEIGTTHDLSPLQVAASVAYLARGETPIMAGSIPDVRHEEQSLNQSGGGFRDNSSNRGRYRSQSGNGGGGRGNRKDGGGGSGKRSRSPGIHRSGSRSHT